MDFKSTMTELTFDAERTRVCTCFEILQDTEVEAEEQFSIILTAANPRLSATATVIIVDDDSEGIQTAHLCLVISVLNLFLEVGQSLFCSDFRLLLPIVALYILPRGDVHKFSRCSITSAHSYTKTMVGGRVHG